jgi:hypothetical protein
MTNGMSSFVFHLLPFEAVPALETFFKRTQIFAGEEKCTLASARLNP